MLSSSQTNLNAGTTTTVTFDTVPRDPQYATVDEQLDAMKAEYMSAITAAIDSLENDGYMDAAQANKMRNIVGVGETFKVTEVVPNTISRNGGTATLHGEHLNTIQKIVTKRAS